jgi:hypothetical protein
LIVFALFGDFVKNYLTLSVGIVHEIFQDFFEPIKLNILLVNFLIDEIQGCHYPIEMLLFFALGYFKFVLNGLEFLKNFRELFVFLIFEVVLK